MRELIAEEICTVSGAGMCEGVLAGTFGGAMASG